MMIGLIGAHGSGKTTLGKAAAEALGWHFCQTSISEVYKRLGKDPAVRMTFDERMDTQYAILGELSVEWASYAGENVIADRTPIDLIAYTLADLDSYTELTPAQELRLEIYLIKCAVMAARDFGKLVLVPNALPVATDPVKVRAALTASYRQKLEVLMRGYMNQQALEFTEIKSTDLSERVEEVRALAV